MINVLVFGMTEIQGGMESFLMNYYRHIDRSVINYSFLCNTMNKIAYEDELANSGASVFHLHSRRNNPFKYRRELIEVLINGPYKWDAFWLNSLNLVNIDYLIQAKRCGIPCRIIHSHNTSSVFDPVRRVINDINRLLIGRYATDYWACSEDAASWLFPKWIAEKAEIISNAIDVRSMAFDERKRLELRKKLGIPSEVTVIGNVGRLHYQKNQTFAIEVFNEYYKQNPQSRLVLVGEGEDDGLLREKCASLDLVDNVVFAGPQSDIQAWLSAFDVFLFPSRYEGLGIALLEAEANGLPILASDSVIPEVVRINDNYLSCSLNDSAETWAGKLNSLIGRRIDNMDLIRSAFQDKGFDINLEAEKLVRRFERIAGKRNLE